MIQQKIRSTSLFVCTVLAVMTGNMALGHASSGTHSATESQSLDSHGEKSVCASPKVILAKGTPHSVRHLYADDGIYLFANRQDALDALDAMLNTPIVPVQQRRNFASLAF